MKANAIQGPIHPTLGIAMDMSIQLAAANGALCAESMNGIEPQDREFFAAIREGREPNASVARVLPCYEVLDRLDRQLTSDRGGAHG